MKKPLKLYCEKCDTVFANTKNVRGHYRAKHPGEIPEVLEDAEEAKVKEVSVIVDSIYSITRN